MPPGGRAARFIYACFSLPSLNSLFVCLFSLQEGSLGGELFDVRNRVLQQLALIVMDAAQVSPHTLPLQTMGFVHPPPLKPAISYKALYSPIKPPAMIHDHIFCIPT